MILCLKQADNLRLICRPKLMFNERQEDGMHRRFFILITVPVILAACAPMSKTMEGSYSEDSAMWKQIIIQFDQNGKQSGLRLITTGGTKDFVKGDGQPIGAAPPDNVLWGDTNRLETIVGSKCVTIGGEKYCK